MVDKFKFEEIDNYQYWSGLEDESADIFFENDELETIK